MYAQAAPCPTIFELAIQGLKEEHAACVQRIGCMASDPDRQTEVQAYLTRIDNINQALIRLAGSRTASFMN